MKNTRSKRGKKVLQPSMLCTLISIMFIAGVSQAQTYTWTGSQNTLWSNASNWTGASGTPTSSSTVVIPNTVNDPVIGSSDVVTINELIVESGATLTILASGVLNVTKTVNGSTNTCITNDGTIINQGVINLTENGATTINALANNGIFQNDADGNLPNSGDLNITDVSGRGIDNNGAFTNFDLSEVNITNIGGPNGITSSGTYTNFGSIFISEVADGTAHFGLRVIENSSVFTNHSVLDITDCAGGIRVLDGATLNNHGIIYLDEFRTDAISMRSESVFTTFNNNAGGIININQRNSSTCRAGLNINEGDFSNTGGRINIDGTNSEPNLSKAIELSGGSTITNEDGGIINMGELTNDIGTSAILIFDGSFLNSSCAGIINHSTEDKISVSDFTTGSFTNIGWIQSYCNVNSKISNNIGSIVNYGSGTFVFNGGGNNPVIEPDPIYTHVWIGEENGDWTNLCNWASETLPNDTSRVWVERKLNNPTLTDDVQLQGLGISGVNTSGLTINPGVTLTVDGSSGVGVLVEGDLVNNGTLEIINTTGAGLQVSNSITLGGKTYIGETGSIGGAGIHTDVGAVLSIGLCAEVYVHKQLTLNEVIHNEGLLWVNTTVAHSGAITNDGVLNFPVGGSGLTITNNDLIINRFNLDSCTVSDVLSIGDSNDFTPAATWYSDEAQTNVIGTYNSVDNTFTPASSAGAGTQLVYFTVNGNGCNFNVQTQYIVNDTITWEGTVGSEWTEPCNWNSGIVPSANEIVLIPDQTNDPIIRNGVVAAAKSLVIQSSAQLTIENGGRINISGSDGNGIHNQGILDCQFNSIVSISDVTGNALYNASGGVINNRGTINITDPDGHGLVNENGTFNNNANGTINLSMNSAPIDKNGIEQLAGDFFNNASNAYIFPIVPNGSGVNISGGTLTNVGLISMIGDLNISTTGTLTTIVNARSPSSQYGQIILNSMGVSNLDGTVNATVNYTPSEGDRIPFINSVNTVSGTFASENLPSFWLIDYTVGSEVALVYCTSVFYADTDGDGYGDPAVSVLNCTAPSGYVSDNTDCDDGDEDEFPGQTWYEDVDDDGYYSGTLLIACNRPTGFKLASELVNTVEVDCNDDDSAVNPAATEVCDGIDNDCNGMVDSNDPSFVDNTPPVPDSGPDCTNPIAAYAPAATEVSDVGNSQYTAQVITPTESSSEFVVLLELNTCKANGIVDAQLDIVSVTSGEPNWTDVLGTAIVPADEIYGLPGCVGGTFGTSTFSYSGVSLQAGVQYALVLKIASGTNGEIFWRRSSTSTDPSNPYSGGKPWIFDLDADTGDESQAVNSALDLQFEVLACTDLPTVTAECSVTLTPPTATDNCAGTVTGTTTDPTSYTEPGTYTVTWTYDDGNGNTSSQAQTVIITGNQVTCYLDSDNDTYGDPAISQLFCETCGTGYVLNNTDCNDSDANVNPNPDCTTTTRTWTGHISTDWDEACNWSPNCVPTANEDVVIPSANNNPIISTGIVALAKSMTLEAGGQLTLEDGGNLTINETLTTELGAELIINLGAILNQGP